MTTIVSIRAPRVGGDDDLDKLVEKLLVSIRAPRVGGDSPLSFPL